MTEYLFNEIFLQPGPHAGNEVISKPGTPGTEPVVICDECGDSLWDTVLEQEYPALKFADIMF